MVGIEVSEKMDIQRQTLILIREYGDKYIKYMQASEESIKELNFNIKENIKNKLSVIFKEDVNYLISIVDELCDLQIYFRNNIDTTQGFDPLYPWRSIKDTTWIGYWKHATGADFASFIYWLKQGINENYDNLIDPYIKQKYIDKKIKKKSVYVKPQFIISANEIYLKYFK